MKRIFFWAAVAVGMAWTTTSSHAATPCDNCGTVTDVKTIKKKGEGSGLGLAASTVLGGPDHPTEKKPETVTQYQVIVKLENGETRTFTHDSQPAYKTGDKIKVVDGKLVRP